MAGRGFVRTIRSRDLRAGVPSDPRLRRVRVGRTDVFLVRLPGGEVLAFDTVCPHQGTSLEDATFWEGRLRCPRHLYLYDLHTGENVLPARDARPENLWKLAPGYLPVHRVEEREGWIWVDEVAQPPPPAYDAELERRPAGARRAEPLPPPLPRREDTVEHPPETVRARAGEEVELHLPTTPRPGHAWRIEVDGPVGLTGQTFTPGTPPTVVVRLAATAAGEGTVRCAYMRPWETPDDAAEVRRYVVRIEG